MCYVRQGSRALLTPKRFSLGRAPETEEHRLVPWYVGGVTFWSFFFFSDTRSSDYVRKLFPRSLKQLHFI